MPSLLESTDYELFDYRHVEDRPLALEEAVKKAASLRATDRSHFHRLIPADSELNTFWVKSVSREEAYAEHANRANSLVIRFLSRLRGHFVK